MGGWKKGAEKGEGCREGVRQGDVARACGGGEGDVTDGGEGEGGGGKGVGGEGGDGEGGGGACLGGERGKGGSRPMRKRRWRKGRRRRCDGGGGEGSWGKGGGGEGDGCNGGGGGGDLWQLGILHQQLGLLGRLPAGLALERPVWSCHGLDTWLLLRLRSCMRTALGQGWTGGRAGRAGRTRQQRRVLDCPRADFRVKSLPMGRYPLILRSRIRWWPWRRRAVSGMG